MMFMSLTRVVIYTILQLVEGVYTTTTWRACVGWASQCDRLVSRSVHVNQSNVPVSVKVSNATLFEEETIYPAKIRKNHHK